MVGTGPNPMTTGEAQTKSNECELVRFSRETEPSGWKERQFKETAHTVVEAGKSEIFRAG